MKTLHSHSYKYLGVKDGMHVFTKFLKDSDPEILYLYRARYVLSDGVVIYYDPVNSKVNTPSTSRLLEYYKGVTKEGIQYTIPIPQVLPYRR